MTVILDWEISGYLPIEWICTKPCVSPGLDFSWNGEGDKQEWRRKLAEALLYEGFDEYLHEYMAWMVATIDAALNRKSLMSAIAVPAA